MNVDEIINTIEPLLLAEPQLKIDFFGAPLTIPFDTEYISVSNDGVVSAHHEMPWYEVTYYEGGENGDVAKLNGDESLFAFLFDHSPFKVKDFKVINNQNKSC